MKELSLMMTLFSLLAGLVFGQQSFGGEHQLDAARYKIYKLGHMDMDGKIPVYAMAKMDRIDDAQRTSLPHQEVITYGRGAEKQVIRKFEGVLWVCMTKVKFPGEPRLLYFAVMHPNNQLRYFKYNPDTKGLLLEIAGEGKGNGAIVLKALKAMAQIPPPVE